MSLKPIKKPKEEHDVPEEEIEQVLKLPEKGDKSPISSDDEKSIKLKIKKKKPKPKEESEVTEEITLHPVPKGKDSVTEVVLNIGKLEKPEKTDIEEKIGETTILIAPLKEQHADETESEFTFKPIELSSEQIADEFTVKVDEKETPLEQTENIEEVIEEKIKKKIRAKRPKQETPEEHKLEITEGEGESPEDVIEITPGEEQPEDVITEAQFELVPRKPGNDKETPTEFALKKPTEKADDIEATFELPKPTIEDSVELSEEIHLKKAKKQPHEEFSEELKIKKKKSTKSTKDENELSISKEVVVGTEELKVEVTDKLHPSEEEVPKEEVIDVIPVEISTEKPTEDKKSGDMEEHVIDLPEQEPSTEEEQETKPPRDSPIEESLIQAVRKRHRNVDQPDEIGEDIIELPKPAPEDKIEAELEIKLTKEKPFEEAKDEVVVQKPKIIEKKTVEGISTEDGIPKKSDKPKEDVTEDVTLKGSKEKSEEIVEEEFSSSKPKKKAASEIETEATLKPHTETIEEVDEAISMKKPIERSAEEVETAETVQVEENIEQEKIVQHEDEDNETQFTIKKLSDEEIEAEFNLIQPEGQETEDVAENFTIKKPPKTKDTTVVEEHNDEYTIKKLKKRRKSATLPEHTEVENVTFRPRSTRTKEDVEQEFNIHMDSYAEEEISMSGKVKLKKPKKLTYSEDADEVKIKVTERYDDKEGPIIEEIDDSGAEDTMYDVDEPEEFSDIEDLPADVVLKLKRKKSSYLVEDLDEEFAVGITHRKKQNVVSYGEDSFTLRRPSRRLPSSYLEGIYSSLFSGFYYYDVSFCMSNSKILPHFLVIIFFFIIQIFSIYLNFAKK